MSKQGGRCGALDGYFLFLATHSLRALSPFFVVLSAQSSGKTFVLIINRENDDGDIVPSEMPITVGSQEELKEVIHEHGGGSLVKEGELGAPRIRSVEDIADGATYNLIDGQNEAVRRHRMWTQVSDKVLEDEAVKAVLSDPKLTSLYGKLEEFHDYNSDNPKCLRAADGTEQEIDGLGTEQEMEIDGLCVNGTTAVVVEAKHHAETKHIITAQKKALYVARVAREGGIPRLSAIEHFIPLLAANRFSALMRKQCAAAGVGVVEPNGSRVRVTHAPPVPRANSGTH